MNEVITCIAENKLPIIVHNGFLDLMHVHLSLPEDLLEILLKTASRLEVILQQTNQRIPPHIRYQVHLQQLSCHLSNSIKNDQSLKLLPQTEIRLREKRRKLKKLILQTVN